MIEFIACSKAYPSRESGAPVPVVDRLSLSIAAHEFVCILGPSGCGKTTLLKMVAGLVTPDGGEVRVLGQTVTGPGPDRGVVFQDFALLPWADVISNIAFGLELRGVPLAERRARAQSLIENVGLEGFERYLPGQLSGGMQQRVGLARALAVDPAVLLMDEPFGSIDAQARRALQNDVLRLHHRHRKTVVFVTHSVDEAVRLADRIVLLSPRPARVDEIIDVGLPRPRPPRLAAHERFVEIKEHLWDRLLPGRTGEW